MHKDLQDANDGRHISTNLLKLADYMSTHLLKSKSEGTVKKYFSYFKKWQNFANSENINSIPAQPIHVALFLTQLIDKKCSNNVVESSVYAIKWAHKLRGLSDPTSNPYITNLLESAKRQNSKPRIKKDIITSQHIIGLCEKYAESNNIFIIRDLAIIVLCYSGFLRYDEVRALLCKHVIFHDDYISLFLPKSKTDQYRNGEEVVISKGVTDACPYKMLSKYVQVANISLDSDHFLFKPGFRSKSRCALIDKNKPLSYTRARETVVARLREVCGDINIGLHSMRAGGASTVARSKVNERCWKRHGRWKSELAKDGYVEDTLEKRLDVTRQLNL